MIQNILANWNLSRVIRLGIGIFIIAEGAKSGMWMLVGLGLLFSLMPTLNIGCGTTGNCAVPQRNIRRGTARGKVGYEEVKTQRDPQR